MTPWEPVSEKFGTGKKSQNRYRKNLVPEILTVFPVVNRNKHWHPLIFLKRFSVISRDKHRHPLIFLRGFLVISRNKHQHPLIFYGRFPVIGKNKQGKVEPVARGSSGPKNSILGQRRLDYRNLDFHCQNFGLKYLWWVTGIVNFSRGIGTGIGKKWYRKKVSEPVSVKFGIGKKSRNRYRKNFVPEKSTGTCIV